MKINPIMSWRSKRTHSEDRDLKNPRCFNELVHSEIHGIRQGSRLGPNGFEFKAERFRGTSLSADPPPIHGELPSERNHQLFAAWAGRVRVEQDVTPALDWSVVRLEFAKPPAAFDKQRAEALVTRLGGLRKATTSQRQLHEP